MALAGLGGVLGVFGALALLVGARCHSPTPAPVPARDARFCDGLRCRESATGSERACGMWEGDVYLFQSDCDMAWFACMSERPYKSVSSDNCGNELSSSRPPPPSLSPSSPPSSPPTSPPTIPSLPISLPTLVPITGAQGLPTLPSLTTAPCVWCNLIDSSSAKSSLMVSIGNGGSPSSQIVGSYSNMLNITLGSSGPASVNN